MRWVSYTRTTSYIEEEIPSDVISMQNSVIADFAKANGWSVQKKYSDRKNDKNESGAFDQMLADGIQRRFDGVIVSSVFRCGKNFTQAKETLAETFFPAGIQFAVAEDKFSSLGKTEEEIIDYFKKRLSEFHSHRMLGQVDRQVAEGKIPFQLRSYGYIFSEDCRSMKIEEEGAAIVQSIFQRFIEGASYSEIAKELNEKEIIAPQEQMALAIGKQSKVSTVGKWRSDTVKRILKNSIYTGKTSCIGHGVEYMFEVPVIIPQNLFDLAQQKVEQIWESNKMHVQHQSRSECLLNKRIYDKKTGVSMYSVENPMVKGERGYLPGPSRGCSRAMRPLLVPEWKVKDAIACQVRFAHQQACYIDNLLRSKEGKLQAEQAITPYRERAKQIVSEMNQICLDRIETHRQNQEGAIDDDDFQKMEETYQDQFKKYEEESQKIDADIKIIGKTYSVDNPWLVCYRDVQIPSELNHDFIKKYINRVLVEDAEHIEVLLKKTEWMNRLPQIWLQDEVKEDL